MGFSEACQAFIVASYFTALKETFGEKGKQAFIHAVKNYGAQRGNRMAQRAIRNGDSLTYLTFQNYGEWAPSADSIAAGKVIAVDVKTTSPDFSYQVSYCPWHEAFVNMGCEEAGACYCTYLDEAINCGFNAEIQFHTLQTKYQGDCCIFKILNAGFEPGSKPNRHPEYVKDFQYHCAHTYYSFAETIQGVFGKAADPVAETVLAAFAEKYSDEMRKQLEELKTVNFHQADSEFLQN